MKKEIITVPPVFNDVFWPRKIYLENANGDRLFLHQIETRGHDLLDSVCRRPGINLDPDKDIVAVANIFPKLSFSEFRASLKKISADQAYKDYGDMCFSPDYTDNPGGFDQAYTYLDGRLWIAGNSTTGTFYTLIETYEVTSKCQLYVELKLYMLANSLCGYKFKDAAIHQKYDLLQKLILMESAFAEAVCSWYMIDDDDVNMSFCCGYPFKNSFDDDWNSFRTWLNTLINNI